MSEVLYRKYRPQTFSNVTGQEHITTTLINALTSGKISHAYLFTGPRGTGKTSVARILAKAVNCTAVKEKPVGLNKETRRVGPARHASQSQAGRELAAVTVEPCNKCDSCIGITNGTFLDLIEIDAASNRGIDDIRGLREKVNFQPAVGQKKVYILDEVHMLTKEAFNALLKTLEEPPAHVMFILCTTEPYKVPETIMSRCQRFDFRLSDNDTLKNYILENAKKEKVKIENDAVELLVKSASGAYRDAIGLLEQLITYKKENKNKAEKINLEDARDLLGLPEQAEIMELMTKVIQKDTKSLLKYVSTLCNKGINLHQFIKETIELLRLQLLIGLEGKKSDIKLGQDKIVNLIRHLNRAEVEMKTAVIPQLPLELALLEFIGNSAGSMSPAVAKEKIAEFTTLAETKRIDTSLEQMWLQILAEVKPKNHTIEALLKSCNPEKLSDGILTLQFFYSFHKERIEEPGNKKIVEDAIAKVFGEKIKVRCLLGEPKPVKKKLVSDNRSNELSDTDLKKIAEEIFGNENPKSQISSSK